MNKDDAIREALHAYFAACDAVDPNQEDGILGASVNQDARYAVDGAVRAAARAVLDTARQFGEDVSAW